MTFFRLAAAAATTGLLVTLGACSGGGALAPGLTAAMNQPGAELDRAQALAILNDYRAVSGVPPLAADPALATTAAQLAGDFARTGTPPVLPAAIAAMRVSAGYTNFADTFSGWRNAPADAAVLADPAFRRAGLAVAYDANSTYGVHWVLLLDD